MDRRVVVTGCGIVSSIGNNCGEVLDSLKNERSGIETVPEWIEYGLRSHIAGTIKLPDDSELRQKIGTTSRYMDKSAIYSTLCAIEAVEDAGLTDEILKSDRTGCIAGSAFSNSMPFKQAHDRISGGKKRIGPFEVTRAITNTVSAHLSYYYGLKGRSYSIGSACATSVHNIGHAYELIKNGVCDTILAGGADEVSPEITSMFDGMKKVMSSSYNETPQKASRPYDKNRDGFVISGGAGIVVLEDLDSALQRNATIYGEIVGFSASTDGHDIVQPDPEGNGGYRCMSEAISNAGCVPADIDYVNTHATSTSAGDLAEIRAIDKIFRDNKVKISSTKSLTGHGIGAAGVQELIYCLLMMRDGFIAASANIEEMDENFSGFNIVTANEPANLNMVLTNSFGFGGTNGSIVLKRH